MNFITYRKYDMRKRKILFNLDKKQDKSSKEIKKKPKENCSNCFYGIPTNNFILCKRIGLNIKQSKVIRCVYYMRDLH